MKQHCYGFMRCKLCPMQLDNAQRPEVLKCSILQKKNVFYVSFVIFSRTEPLRNMISFMKEKFNSQNFMYSMV